MHRVRVWDLPTRLFHWSLALAVLGLLVTGQIGGNAMNWHLRFGQAVLALLLTGRLMSAEEAQAVGHVSSPAAITNCWAMSATRRFWSMAVLRSRA